MGESKVLREGEDGDVEKRELLGELRLFEFSVYF